MTTSPTVFKASVGGYMGPFYQVVLCDDGVRYQCCAVGDSVEEEVMLDVPAAAWTTLAKTLEQLDAWEWTESYVLPALDGTSWQIELIWGEQTLQSSGSNAYPERWPTFCRAVEKLLGGRAFG